MRLIRAIRETPELSLLSTRFNALFPCLYNTDSDSCFAKRNRKL